MNIKIAPKIIPGILHQLNKGAVDWGWQGKVAYGCQNTVVVADARTTQHIQSLDGHRSYVAKVRWSRENYYHDLNEPYQLRLATADHVGRIIVWNVLKGEVRADFCDGNKPVQELEWLPVQDSSNDLLLVIHPPYSIVLWRADSGLKLWKKSYTDPLISFSFDPFDIHRLAFLGEDCILFVEDFSMQKAPSSNGKKFYISSPSQAAAGSSSTNVSEKKKEKNTFRRVSQMLVGDSKQKSQSPDEDSIALNECLQLVFLKSCRHHLVLLYQREILILDLEISQTVGIVPLDRAASAFSQVIPCRQRDALYCLHDNGSITMRLRKTNHTLLSPTETVGAFGTPEDAQCSPLDVYFELKCQSDPIRLTKHVKIYGVVCDPCLENKICLLMSDGRLIFWSLKSIPSFQDSVFVHSPMFSPWNSFSKVSIPSDCTLPLQTAPKHPNICLSDSICGSKPEKLWLTGQQINLRFVLTGIIAGLLSDPVIIKMCPPLTTKNYKHYKAIVAVGSQHGSVQLFNISDGTMWKEVNIHSHSIRGLEWVDLDSFISFSYSPPGPNNLVRNDLKLTDVRTGQTMQLRKDRDEEMPIKFVRVSYLKQYFVVAFKDKAFEVWDLKSGNLLREMPKSFPNITAMCWSPTHSLKKKPSMEASQTDLAASMTSVIEETTTGTDGKTVTQPNIKEHFVFTDITGLLYHFLVEGNVIKDGAKIPPDSAMSTISNLTWKADLIVISDTEGNIGIWDLKQKSSKTFSTHRGWIRKIKFAPGRGNMKLLVFYDDGIDIWELKVAQTSQPQMVYDVIASVKSPRDIIKIVDCDWAGSDKPIILAADGCLRVVDLNFKSSMSAMSDYIQADPVFGPHLLDAKSAFTLKYMLQHQPWNKEFSFNVMNQLCDPEIEQVVNSQLNTLDSQIKDYLKCCQFGVAERCLITALLFGDESECHFWMVALHYLRGEKADPLANRKDSLMGVSSSGDLFVPSQRNSITDLLQLDDKQTLSSDDWMFIKDQPLQMTYDVFTDKEDFLRYQLNRVNLHDSKRVTYEHTTKCTENLILLGQTDRAVQLLLETEAENVSYYTDSLKSCLVASIRSSGASQSTIKLVSTNLIANGKLMEGAQLLCLIDKGLDACRYLQTYGHWNQAAWLAKATLGYAECSEVMKRWADHLCTGPVNQKSRAVLVLLSLGQFCKVIEMLYGLQQFDRAAMFCDACLEFNVLDNKQENKVLIEAVYLAYARHLLKLGNKTAAVFYCERSGHKGQQMIEQIKTQTS